MTAFLNAALKVLRIVGRFIIFILLVLLALSNTQEIHFQLLPGLSWELPLIFVLFIAFVLGILLTLLSGVSIRRLKQPR
ncbi:DUF1049 domain-containing protein [Polynucleobacter sp. MWH-Spelu-300-X4]|jgi:uncharacterized integral membrane protein|uniref:lipopolysaccharide assembly protein LapA domain-containing protein n=1 Tax=Polynucleobacter sp. MWH-Spelu-300-X4 TaxID=2689109 RepID=UPI001BFE13F9|nr:lipopolysaccharide assembly protein LapA domain-containing protein [Polynucleobacter sp. MWH-Spelu-300-X4]QWD80233.1 DUF1049 domain-containing protein [Polynucleobacter sp. MWH-Spelu-300-X4]